MYSRLNLNLLLSVDLHSEHRWSCSLIKLLPPVLILYQPTGPPLHVADLNYGSRIHSLAVQVLPGSVTLFCAQHVGERAPTEGPNARLQIHLSANVGNMSKMPLSLPARGVPKIAPLLWTTQRLYLPI